MVDKQREIMQASWFGAFAFSYWCNVEVFRELQQKLFRAHSIESLKHSIVVENPKIVCWIEKSHKEVKTLFTGHFLAFLESYLLSALSNVVCSCGTVMAVCNVEVRDFLEFSHKPVCFFGSCLPENVSNVVRCRNIAVARA